MNAAEAGMRQWLDTPAGRVFSAMHGGPARALAELYRHDQAETGAARALQDEMETTRGRRPDFAEARVIVHRPPPVELSGPTEDVVRALNRFDPAWRVRADAEPGRVTVVEPWRV